MEKKFEFEHFERVVARETKGSKWCCDFYSHYDADRNYPFVCVGGYYEECVPYEGNAHLVNTTDPYEPPYVPQNGDFVVCSRGDERKSLFIFDKMELGQVFTYAIYFFSDERLSIIRESRRFYSTTSILRPATKEEKQLILSKLHVDGRDWDADKKEIVPLYKPMDGDFVCIDTIAGNFIAIFREKKPEGILHHSALSESDSLYRDGYIDLIKSIRPAAEEEKQKLLSKLHKIGKDWDAEKKEVVDLKWEPNKGEIVYMYDFCNQTNRFISCSIRYDGDTDGQKLRNEKGNLFKTSDECLTMCNKLNEAIKPFQEKHES